MGYNKAVLEDQIRREVNRTAYITCDADASTLSEMLSEINLLGYSFRYLAELIQCKISDKSSQVIENYINRFCCEGPRGYLVGKLDINKRDNAMLIVDLYRHFQKSDVYIAAPGTPAPAHIYTRYDNAFFKLKTAKVDSELLSIILTPRDICYLPLASKMLASRNAFNLQEIIKWYHKSDCISASDIGLPDNCDRMNYPPLSYFQRQLKFIAISCLQYYPSQEALLLLTSCSASNDKDLAAAAKKSLRLLSLKSHRE